MDGTNPQYGTHRLVRTRPGASNRTSAAGNGPGSPFSSLHRVFWHHLLQFDLVEQLLQPAVLGTQFLESFSFIPSGVLHHPVQVDSVASSCRKTEPSTLPACTSTSHPHATSAQHAQAYQVSAKWSISSHYRETRATVQDPKSASESNDPVERDMSCPTTISVSTWPG